MVVWSYKNEMKKTNEEQSLNGYTKEIIMIITLNTKQEIIKFIELQTTIDRPQ